ncbi:unnamed protein product [marine sediment metagenome]|uniref:Uncharacterized protein n=1 Tax=marine sediment metagenome TaxID=412755 RepID=X1MNA7_9ZZZZ
MAESVIQTVEEYPEPPKRKCYECGNMLPLTEFYRDKSRKEGRRYLCKKCDKKDSKKFYRNRSEYFKRYKDENRDHILLKARECNFLNSTGARTGGYLRGTGICVFCGEIEPFLLELHHPFGPEHPFKIHECANCHRLQHRFPAMLEVTL